jgi:hypothetical protein
VDRARGGGVRGEVEEKEGCKGVGKAVWQRWRQRKSTKYNNYIQMNKVFIMCTSQAHTVGY